MAKQKTTSKPSAAFELPKMEFATVDIPIIGDTPLISNKWNDEQIAKIKAKQEGVPTPPQKPREVVMSRDDLRQQVLSEAARLLAQAQERLEDVSGMRKAKTLVRQAHKAVQSQVKPKTAAAAG